MKKKIGVCLFVVAILAASLFCFAACDDGGEGGEAHAHTYSVLKHDDTSHWYECECGEKDESTVTAHAGGTATCTDKAVCEICRTAYGALNADNHTSTKYVYESNHDGTHSKTHACCHVAEEEAENCGGGSEPTCKTKSVCITCRGEYGELDENNHEENTYHYESNNNGTHKKLYDCCDKAAEESESCSGGTATCISKAVCTDCGGEHGDYAEHTFTAWDTSDETYDKPKCSVDGCGAVDTEQSNWFDKTVTAKNQDLLMTGESFAISLTGVSDYDSVQSIMLGSENLGTDITALQIPDTVKNDPKAHGEQTLTVTVVADGSQHEVSVPVTLITKSFTDMQDFLNTVKLQNGATEDIYGYYILANDIAWADSMTAPVGSWTWDDGKAFRGTLDGREHKITMNSSKYSCGLFSVLNGATIKNVQMVEQWFNANNQANTLIARAAYNTTFENVIITIAGNSNVKKDVEDYTPLIGHTMKNCTWKNVTISTNIPLGAVFGNVADTTFEGVTIDAKNNAIDKFAVNISDAPDGVTISNLPA